MSIHIHPFFRAREVAQEQAGLLPDPAKGQAVDSDGIIDLKYSEATGGFHQVNSAGMVFYFNSGQQIDSK